MVDVNWDIYTAHLRDIVQPHADDERILLWDISFPNILTISSVFASVIYYPEPPDPKSRIALAYNPLFHPLGIALWSVHAPERPHSRPEATTA